MMQTLAAGLALFALFVRESLGCPGGCICTMRYSAPAANCAYGSFQLVPVGLPSNLSSLTLSANAITFLQSSSFEEVPHVSSLWLAHNEIESIQRGTFAVLAELKSLDLSHNHVRNFPWEDLASLTILIYLKIDNNWLTSLPRDAFSGLKSLRSLHINNNRLTTIFKGTFDSLDLLSNLQIHDNQFNCTCPLQWLKEWAANTKISIAEQDSIVCFSPKPLQGIPFGKTPKLQCSPPYVKISYHPTTELQEDHRLMLHCNVTGSPCPNIKWKIQATKTEICDFTPDGEYQKWDLTRSPNSHKLDSYLVFPNRTLVITHVRRGAEGLYTCVATNDLGTGEDSVEVSITSSLNAQHFGVRVHRSNATRELQHGKVIVLSPPGEGIGRNRGDTALKAPAWFWIFTILIFRL
ncbi:immunoglobulin superfamily containing leucine-rich repeat protein [Ambystoma mexicanum]|uniref:immunoglobulin superfamily containing leucine-rich repeat protein n=1 Tax=Ambystoma mexicanum TaxID=8296 RepID=UPI0037E82000